MYIPMTTIPIYVYIFVYKGYTYMYILVYKRCTCIYIFAYSNYKNSILKDEIM